MAVFAIGDLVKLARRDLPGEVLVVVHLEQQRHGDSRRVVTSQVHVQGGRWQTEPQAFAPSKLMKIPLYELLGNPSDSGLFRYGLAVKRAARSCGVHRNELLRAWLWAFPARTAPPTTSLDLWVADLARAFREWDAAGRPFPPAPLP